jgi:hypothetical protein
VDYGMGLIVVDISDPTAPVEKAQLDLRGYLNDVAVSGKYAYVSGINGGVRIVRFW